jgi:hypothetical protein
MTLGNEPILILARTDTPACHVLYLNDPSASFYEHVRVPADQRPNRPVRVRVGI